MEQRRAIQLAPTKTIRELLISMPYEELMAFAHGFRTGVIASSGLVDVNGVRVGPANEELTIVLAYLKAELDDVIREWVKRHRMVTRNNDSDKRSGKPP